MPGVPRQREPEPPRLSPEIAALLAAAQALARSAPAALPPEQALADIDGLMQAKELLRVAELDRYHDAHVRNLAALEDAASLGTWVRKRYDDPDRGDIGLSKKLVPYAWLRHRVQDRSVSVPAASAVGSALKRIGRFVDRADGRIDGLQGDEVVAAVVRNVLPLVAGSRLGLHDEHPLLAQLDSELDAIVSSGGSQLGRLERAFTVMAEHIPLAHLRPCLEQQTDALLPSALEEEADRGHASRSLRLDPQRALGGGRLTVDADDELYELAVTCLAAEVRRDPENTADTEARRRTVHGEVPEDADVEAQGEVRFPRTQGQRMHDALKLVLQRYLAAGLSGRHDKQPVAVTITVSAENLKNEPGALPAVGGSGRRLPASLVRHALCDADVSVLVHTTGLIPLGITHEQRTLSGKERKALRVQQANACAGLRCCTPGDPMRVLVPHHTKRFSVFGKTRMAESILACDRLHDAIHRGKTVQLRDGRWLNEHGYTAAPALWPTY